MPPPHPLPTEALGHEGESPAPISPLSPLHSPDSLEELSLTESPNQPPTSGPAGPLGSFSSGPQSKEKEGDPGPGRSKNQEDHLDPLGGPYLSLGKDPGPHNPCEDSGVSFSPEEKLIGSERSLTGPAPPNPQTMVPQSDLASSNPTEHWDSPYLSSQETPKVSMDPFSKDTPPLSSGFGASDLQRNHSDEDEEEDDLMYNVKKDNNSFDGFSPLADSGYSHFGESKMESKAPTMSESPTPDLVQYGQAEALESPPSYLDEKEQDLGRMAVDAPMKSVHQFSAGLKDEDEEEDEEEEEDSVLPPSLPDILKSSPLNPDKLDSGSSEGSPEEQSPILERKMMESPNPPINLSANNPFALDAKVSLLKEMTEEMEVRVADKGKAEEEEKSYGAFDLVREVEETAPSKVKEEESVKVEEKDWFSSHDPPKTADRFQPLDFQVEKTPAEDSDSESPTADSLSPVLEAMAKNPASFQVETEKKSPALLEEAEAAEEVSEHEVSSEEFEFIERPPRGVIDEFLEALDTSKFATSKPPEIPLDDELTFDPKVEVAAAFPPQFLQPEINVESSYHLLTSATSQQKSKAELETLDIQQAPPTESSVGQEDKTVVQKQMFQMPNLNIRAGNSCHGPPHHPPQFLQFSMTTLPLLFSSSVLLKLLPHAPSIVLVCFVFHSLHLCSSVTPHSNCLVVFFLHC